MAPLSEFAYRLVADHRRSVSRITHWLWGPDRGPSTYLLTRWLFIRAIGVVYLIAFASLGVQVLGLIGSQGILPVTDYLQAVHRNLGRDAYWQISTLAWLNCGDAFLQFFCRGGAALSLLVVLRIAPAALLVVLWMFYLSLYKVGQTFLSFQWDLLLLEAGLLAVFFAPWNLRPGLSREPPPSGLILWLIRWLLFRLMFCSGVVKLLDEDPANPTWAQLTALTYHYETQCIPNAIAWFALFMKRLLEGEEEVLKLLETNPFPEGPPRYVRATLYDYHFTDAPTRRKTGMWWTRTRLRPYGPVLSLQSFGGR